MLNTLKLTKQVVLQPGEYTIKELVFTADYLVPTTGALKDYIYYIIDPDVSDRIYSERFPITLSFYSIRNWRTMWRRRDRVEISDGVSKALTIEQRASEITLLHSKS